MAAPNQLLAQFLGISPSPAFIQPAISNQLNLNPAQMNQLAQSYSQYLNQFNSGVLQLGTLSNAQRLQTMQQLSSTFFNGLGQSAQQTLNPTQMQRFQQMLLQSRGASSLLDPAVQGQLQLTASQLQQIQSGGVLNLNGMPNNPALLGQFRQEQLQGLRLFLTPEQWEVWQQMIGQPLF